MKENKSLLKRTLMFLMILFSFLISSSFDNAKAEDLSIKEIKDANAKVEVFYHNKKIKEKEFYNVNIKNTGSLEMLWLTDYSRHLQDYFVDKYNFRLERNVTIENKKDEERHPNYIVVTLKYEGEKNPEYYYFKNIHSKKQILKPYKEISKDLKKSNEKPIHVSGGTTYF